MLQQTYWPLIWALALALVSSTAVYIAIKSKVKGTYSGPELKINEASFKIGSVTALFAIFGIIAAFLAAYGISDSPSSNVVKLFGTNLLAAATGGSLGALLGFLFGIPRTLDPAARAAVADADGRNSSKTDVVLASNTNLERVSDWLTTLLIGATLVQLGAIVPALKSFAQYLTSSEGQIQGPLLLILAYFFVLGFLGIYLITRLFLTNALTQSLAMLVAGQHRDDNKTLASAISEAKPQTQAERSALLSLIDRWPVTDGERSGPDLNFSLAILLYDYLSSQGAEHEVERREKLQETALRAAEKPELRKRLVQRFEDGLKDPHSKELANNLLTSLSKNQTSN
ncbi:hypothetical protein [Rhizobium sp. Rhizsp82]|uniref:hypothetical protein n=1 Tax=Rhizobium sp. Rhizsp82 TaxID=3243057 RepID=UPI0039B60BF7